MNNWKKRIFKILFDILLVVLAYFFALETVHKNIFIESPYPYIGISGKDAGNAEDYEQLRTLLDQYAVRLVAAIRSWDKSGVGIDLVGTEDALTAYTDWTGIDAGHYGSFIGTGYEVKKYCWENMPEVSESAEVRLYFVSDGNAKRDLPAKFILSLGAGDLSGWKTDLKGTAEESFWKIFVIVTIIMLLFEGYQALYETKGYVLRLLFGEHIGTIVLKKVLADVLVIGGAYTGCFFIAAKLFRESIPLRVLLCVFCLFILGDLFISLLAFAKSWKRALVRIQESKALTGVSYTIRVVLLTVLIVLCNVNIACLDVYKKATAHDEFYNYFSGYGALSGGYGDADYLYLELLKENKAALLYHSTDYQGKPVVNVNQVSFGFLEQINNAFSFQESMREQVIIYYPEGMVEPSELAGHVIAGPLEGGGKVSFVPYQGKVDLPLQRGTEYNPDLLTWASQPVIVADFRNDLDFFADTLSEDACFVWMESYLVRLDDIEEEYAEYVSERGTVYSLKNVKKIYTDSIWPYLLMARYVTLLLLLMGMMEIILTVRIVFLEFQMEAAKYISRRLLGAGFIETYGAFFMTTIVLCMMGGICSCLVIKEDFSGMLCLAVCIVTGAVEILIQMLYVLKLEKANFPKLLKGGIL